VQYQSDYILRLIEQMGALIRRALETEQRSSDDQPYELATEALGLALDIDPATAARLSPESLASLLELSNVDDRVIGLVSVALEIQAEELEARGEIRAGELRRKQAMAARDLVDRARPN